MNKLVNKLSFIYILLFFIPLTSLSGVILLAYQQYSAQATLIIGIILSIFTSSLLKPYLPKITLKVDYILILLLVVAFILRFPAMNYLEGGQDQGIYPAISKIYERTGGIYEKDNVRDALSYEGKVNYDASGQRVIALQRYSINESEFLFPFYPVHPILLSISAFIFGESMRSFSLTLLSIISIVGMYLLSSTLFKSRKVGLISAGILTILPLHVYFSKLPVTEIPSLAFILFGFYFLYKYYEGARKDVDEEDSNYWGLLVLSALFFLTFFFTRISGVLYLPFFALLTILTIEFTTGTLKRNVLIYFLSIFLGFFISLLYYYKVIPYLFWHFYIDYFTKRQLEEVTLILLLIPLLFYAYNRYFVGTFRSILLYIGKHFGVIVNGLLIIVLGFSIYAAYSMGFTDQYIGTVYDMTWKMAENGISVLKDLSMVSIVAHLGPFIAIPLLLAMYFKKSYRGNEIYVYTFFLLFLLFTVFITRFIPHQYYFARYQLTEVIPFAVIIFASIAGRMMEDGRRVIRVLIYLILSLSLMYFGVYTISLRQGSIGGDTKFFESIQKEVNGERDLILYFDPKGLPPSFSLTPLRHYYGLNVYMIKSFDEIDMSPVTELVTKFENIYILSSVVIEGVKDIGEYQYTHSFYGASSISPAFPLDFKVSGFDIPLCNRVAGAFSHYCGGIIPSRYHVGTMPFYLYQVKGE